ncbi:energy transducer TonB [Acinetobacter nectaris]|uniref:energy transducer TonB n=1 Tax=Acinetobacter nectaris TaxID=1219382 RepID=UPI001F3109D0|nr:energy transducer TonB [Acinetobacter nectaris]MCF9045565.1 energy transducer TonB [Acinetobacter nectaris]
MPEYHNNISQDITVVLTPSHESLNNADFLAEQDQRGGGQLKDKKKISTILLPIERTESQGAHAQTKKDRFLQQTAVEQTQERMLVTTLSWKKEVENHEQMNARDAFESSYSEKEMMIKSLEAQYLKQQQIYAKLKNTETIDSVEAKKDSTAKYLEQFREKVELFGNRDYPLAAKQQGLSGDVRLMVVLEPDGSVKAIHLLESSGHSILDEAAKRSVRRGAPFGKFSQSMNLLSELRVIRTWRFHTGETQVKTP